MGERYIANWASLKNHRVPAWYDDCKLGIFIHWGLYSVPAFAPVTGELGTITMDEQWFCNNPYAEWYFNSVNVGQGPSYEYHLNKYGKDFRYESFTDLWKAENWDPAAWASLFKESGAGYVVLTSKHHDGFCLFDSRYTDYTSVARGPQRDIVGDLSSAVRVQGMKMGLYYSGMLDWRFYPGPHFTDKDMVGCPTYEYADYAFKQSMELIDKYHPSVFWNDIGWPYAGEAQLPYLLAHYYNVCADGVVDDRFNGLYKDFSTKEYQAGDVNPEEKWEMCRGLGLSFGYNAMEDESTVMSADRLIALLVSTVAHNGNLLINIGPKADGTIPEIQASRLRALGAWMKINGEAIYGTRPAGREDIHTDTADAYFTAKGNKLYLLADSQKNGELVLPLRDLTGVPRALDDAVDFEVVRTQDGESLIIKNYCREKGAIGFLFE